MSRWPLRVKVALWTALLGGLVVTLFGVGASMQVYHRGIAQLEGDMAAKAESFFRELEEQNFAVNWNEPTAVDELFPGVGRPFPMEVVNPDGQLIFRSRKLGGEGFPPLVGDQEFVTASLLGDRFRLGSFTGDGFIFRVGSRTEVVDETWHYLLQAYFIAGPVVLLVVGFGGWWIAGRALSPVREIILAAEAITGQSIHQRLPMPLAQDELGQLTRVLNRMIERLEASLNQATRFSADASHELRTPLTIIRGELESALRNPEITGGAQRLMVTLLEETERLTAITDGLLLLSRADAGRLKIEHAQVDLSSLLRELVEDAEILAAQEEITIQAEIPSGIEGTGHPPFLRRLIVNLLENAIKYNKHNGEIRVRLSSDHGQRIISVANTGEGIPPEHAKHIFERFYRGLAAERSRRAGHGLGLSICRELARAHGGDVALIQEDPAWTEFRVTLPGGAPLPPLPSPPQAALAG